MSTTDDRDARTELVGGTGQAAAVPAALALAALLGLLIAFALSPFLTAIAADLGGSVALLGQTVALLNLLGAGLCLLVGPVAERVGPRRTLLTGLLAPTAGVVTTALAAGYPMLLLGALLGALARATIQPLSLALAASHFDGPARRRAIAWSQSGNAGAFVIGIPLLALVAGLLGWRGGQAALALLWRLLPPDTMPPARPRLRGVLAAYAPLADHAPTLGLVGAALLGTAGTWVVVTYLAAFLVQVHGLPEQPAGLAYLLPGLGYLVGTVATGGPLGRSGLRPLLIGARVLQAGLLASVILLPVGGAGTILPLVFLSGVMTGVSNVAGMTLVAGESPTGRATTMTPYQTGQALGVAAGSALGGLLLAVGSYPALGLGAPLLGLAAALLVWQARPRGAPAPAPIAAG